MVKKRSLTENKTATDNCIICGEFGKGGEWDFAALFVPTGRIKHAPVQISLIIMCVTTVKASRVRGFFQILLNYHLN